MSKKEIIAYAITHAPRGQKGGPYEADDEEAWEVLRHVRKVHPHARVIRIVRAQPSEASAVEVLRELVAWERPHSGHTIGDIVDRARRVIAASGPDPMPVVRAAMAWRDWDATPDTTTDADLSAAVDAYRTLAALDDEYQAAVAATKGEGE